MARLDRRRRLDADSDGVERRRRIHQLKAEQATLKVELAAAKLRLGIGVHQWSYELHVEEAMDADHPSFVEVLERETAILAKRVAACKSRVLMATCFVGGKPS